MSEIAVLLPENMPRCDAIRTQTYANDTPDTNRQCNRQARYRIRGKCYCLRHAEMAALQILLSEGLNHE